MNHARSQEEAFSMNDQHFDDLARTFAESGKRRTTRRKLLRALGVGGAAGLASSVTPGLHINAALQDATPAATPEPPPVVNSPLNVITVADKANELLYDKDTIFQYVANEVHYEAYSGALRGDRGTLWGMAGNSVDQSLLLAALLKEALFEVRYAIGPLDDATAQQLAASMALDHDAFRDQDLRAQFTNLAVNGVSVAQATPEAVSTPALTTEQQQVIDQATKAKDAQVAEAEKQLTASVKIITDALASKNVSLPDATAPALPDRERQQHVWVQIASGTEWIDLDPSMPNAEAGKAYATAAQTLDELPPELDHIVRFRVVKEVVSGGAPYQSDAVVLEHTARDLVGMPISFSHVSPDAFQGLGLTISGLVEGTTNFIPTFFVGRDVLAADQPIQFGTGGGLLGALGDEGSNEGDTLAEWLITEIVTPDGAIDPIQREIFDRVGYEQRATATESGTPIDLSKISPIELIDVGEGGSIYPPMIGIIGLAVVGGQVPSWLIDPARANVDDLSNISLGIHGYHMLRDRLSIESVAPKGYRYYNDAPNVTSFVFWPENVTAGQSPEFTVESDLIFRSVATVPVSGAQTEANAGILAGVIAHVAERVSLETTDWTADYEPDKSTAPPPLSVGRVFEAAAGQNVATAVLQLDSAEADMAALSVSPQASLRIKEALAAGFVVIVPEKPVTLDGKPISGWWQVDPTTGYTMDRMENGRGAVLLRGMSLFGPFAEYAQILGSVALRAWTAFKRLGCIIAITVTISGILWTVSSVQAGYSGAGTYANLGAAATAALGGAGSAFAKGACFGGA
jgi:transglutaminase-like putative cysteine protease